VLKLLKQKITRAQEAPRQTPEHFAAPYASAAEPADRPAEPPAPAAPAAHASYNSAPAVPPQVQATAGLRKLRVDAEPYSGCVCAQVAASAQRRISAHREAASDAVQERDALIRELRETNEARWHATRIGLGAALPLPS
jgi:hypothetical protein